MVKMYIIDEYMNEKRKIKPGPSVSLRPGVRARRVILDLEMILLYEF